MLPSVLVAVGFATLLVTGPAQAASVTNLDDIPRTVIVEEAGSKEDHVVNPGAVLDRICLDGCLVYIGSEDDDPYELEGSDVTSIEDGQLWGEDQVVPDMSP